MSGNSGSANLIKWQRVSIASLLLALLVTGAYSSHQIRRAESDLALVKHRMDAREKEAAHSHSLLQKERDVTEGLKSYMTFDRIYIQNLEAKLAKYETGHGKTSASSTADQAETHGR